MINTPDLLPDGGRVTSDLTWNDGLFHTGLFHTHIHSSVLLHFDGIPDTRASLPPSLPPLLISWPS